MKKSLLMFFLMLSVLSFSAFAQTRIVTGRVTDATNGEGVPGATVQLKGTSTAAPTNVDGSYSITIPSSGGTLVFSFIGYSNKEIVIGNQSTINVELATDAEAIQEIVVVGYGTSTQQSFTGTAKVVSGEALNRKNVANVSQALAGEVAGVRVINTSGQPGTVATIRVRGLGSVNGNRDPLYVVDGVPFQGGLNSINPADIESTTVLKDAAATAIYGSRGANGVVLITTRSGRGQQAYVEADANFGTNMALLPRYDVIRSPEQYIALGWESIYNYAVLAGGFTPTQATNYANTRLFNNSIGVNPRYNLWNVTNGAQLIDPATRTVRPDVTRKYDPENWEEYAFQSSSRREVNLKLGGSSGGTNYYTSFGYLDDKGYSINTDFQRLSARVNVNQEVKKWLTAGLNFNYARTESNNNGQGSTSNSVFWLVDNMPAIYPLYLRDATGQIVQDPIFGGNQFDYGQGRGFAGLTNAVGDATYNVVRTNRNELNGNASLNFNITEGLTFENRIGVQYFNNKGINRSNKYYGGGSSSNGRISHGITEMTSYNLLNLLRYSKNFGDHGFEVLAAHEATDWKQEISSAAGFNLVRDDLLTLGNAIVTDPNSQGGYINDYGLESYFGQINYNFSQRYFLSASVRRDASSRFRNDKWGTFGSLGAAWLISEEAFMGDQTIFSNLKLKASYGLVGDQAGVGLYSGYNLSTVGNLNDLPSIGVPTVGNPDLTWETSKMFQTGIEFGIGKYVSGSIDYYNKNTEDLIFERRVGPSAGYALITVNSGQLRNRGLEFDLTGHLVQTSNFKLNLNVNGEIFSNEITEMPLDPVTNMPKPLDVQTPYAWSKGRSIFDFYMREWAGVDPADGAGRWTVHYTDTNNNGEFDSGEEIRSLSQFLNDNPEQANSILVGTTKEYSEATQKYIGKSAIPDVRGAVNLSADYKGLELNVQMIYSFGGYAYDYAYASLMHSDRVGSNNWHTDILNRWQSVENPGNGNVPRLSNEFDVGANSTSSRFLTKANYLVLNNVRLGYNFPNSLVSKFGVGGLSVWVSGDNLWTQTERDGFNPFAAETGNTSVYQFAPLSTVSGGLRIKF